MGKRTISFDVEFRAEQEERMERVLQCGSADLGEKLGRLAKAGLRELVCMASGGRSFGRSDAYDAERLAVLIEELFEGEIPGDAVVARLFQRSETDARALMKRLLSGESHRLGPALEATCKRALDRRMAMEGGTDRRFEFACSSRAVVDELNRIISDIDSRLPPIKRDTAAAAVYVMSASTEKALAERFGLPPVQGSP